MTSKIGHSYLISRHQLDRFAKALSQAVHDRLLEQSYKLKFFYDADVAVWMALGFQYLDVYNKKPSERLLLVRALQSAGYLGIVNLLRPHALELDALIRRQTTSTASGIGQGFSKKVQDFLQAEGVDGHIRHLLSIVEGALSEEEQIDRFLRELQEIGAQTFASLELANGNWQQRLNRIHDRLSFDNSGDSIESMVKDSRVWMFYKIISSERPRRKGLSLNNLQDAAAFTILNRMIAAWNPSSPNPIVRFHTEGESLARAWNNHPEMKSALSYPSNDETYYWDENFIFRDLDYFVVRASFKPLSFEGLESRPDTDPAITLSDLNKLSKELTEILQDTDPQSLQRVESMALDGKPLTEVMWEVESLSFIRNVFSRYKPPDPLKRLILGLQEVWGFAHKGQTQKRVERELRKEVTRLSEELGERVADLRDWLDILRDVQKKADKLRRKLKEHEIPDPMRDLGLVRWAADIDDSSTRRIQEIIQSLISPDDEKWSYGCTEFASLVGNVTDSATCIVSCAILWTLSLFDRVVEIINNYEDRSKGKLPPSFIVMRSAARLRGHNAFSRTEKQKHIQGLLELKDRVEGTARGRLLLGLGYITYYAWYLERHHDSSSTKAENSDDPIHWAELSFSLGEESIDLLKDDRLGRAFAVNHCAYVGGMTGIQHQKSHYYLHRLTEIRGEEDLWHYRFADTIAYNNFIEANRTWLQLKETTDSALIRKYRSSACKLLKEAEDLLNDAGPYFGDPEIPQHRLEVQSLARTLGC